MPDFPFLSICSVRDFGRSGICVASSTAHLIVESSCIKTRHTLMPNVQGIIRDLQQAWLPRIASRGARCLSGFATQSLEPHSPSAAATFEGRGTHDAARGHAQCRFSRTRRTARRFYVRFLCSTLRRSDNQTRGTRTGGSKSAHSFP